MNWDAEERRKLQIATAKWNKEKKKAKKNPKPKRTKKPKLSVAFLEQRDLYRKYLKSKEWAEVKLSLYEVRGKKCELCGSESNIQVHHLHYKNIYKEEPEDLILLCNKCHKAEHGLK